MRLPFPVLLVAALQCVAVASAQGAPAEAAPSAREAEARAEEESANAAEGEAAADDENGAAAFEASLGWKTGDVVVGDKLATLHLGQAFRYLGPEDTERVLTAWGNPPGSAALGMLFPPNLGPTAEESWAVVIHYSDDGHVEDEDAADIDYDELLSTMKDDTKEANEERKKAGFEPVHLIGWAEPPRYDAASHKLFWAKELDFGNHEHTLNYDIRVLGRKGVLELSMVSSIKQLPLVKSEMPKLLQAVEFNPGMRYADYDSNVDTLAAYGIGALVAGKVAAKAGLLKVILGVLLASKKLIVAGVVALGVLAKKLLGRKSDSTTTTQG